MPATMFFLGKFLWLLRTAAVTFRRTLDETVNASLLILQVFTTGNVYFLAEDFFFFLIKKILYNDSSYSSLSLMKFL